MRPYREFRAKAGKTEIVYGYSTRQAGFPDFYAALEKKLPVNAPDQIHSAKVIAVRKAFSRNAVQCDALVTDRAGQILTVRTADCLPIFFWDSDGKAVAVTHAGWKGTRQKIAARTVARLKRLGADPARLRVVFGPAIRSCCYEVGPEFAGRFDARTLQKNASGRLQFDLVLANRLQLERAGVPPQNIKDLKLCTACDTKTFYSFRRDPANTGRMIHWIYKKAPTR